MPAPLPQPIIDAEHALRACIAPPWPWSQAETRCAAAQLAAITVVCSQVLPVLQRLEQLVATTDRAAAVRLQRCAQSVRNALPALHELALAPQHLGQGEAVAWQMLAQHRQRIIVRQDARPGADALADMVMALGRTAFVAGQIVGQPAQALAAQRRGRRAVSADQFAAQARAVLDSAADVAALAAVGEQRWLQC